MTNDEASARLPQLRRTGMWLATVAVALVVGVCVAWAGTVVLRPAIDVSEQTDYTFVSVQPGEVGASFTLNALAAWTTQPVGSNKAAGTVTEILLEAGAEAHQGTVLFSVDLQPVVVAAGQVPAFRDIGRDTTGRDVEQLQQMLQDTGFYGGVIDGKAGAGTVASIKGWQKAAGMPETGVVKMSDVIFVPSLPARLALDSTIITRGATLAGGEAAVLGLPEAPRFTLPVSEGQSATIPPGTTVELASPSGSLWRAIAGERQADPASGVISIDLEGDGGQSVCEAECASIPVGEESRLVSRVITSKTVTGLTVPSAALVTDAEGQTAVVDLDGARIGVSVTASARGMSVIEGVQPGLKVRVPATEATE